MTAISRDHTPSICGCFFAESAPFGVLAGFFEPPTLLEDLHVSFSSVQRHKNSFLLALPRSRSGLHRLTGAHLLTDEPGVGRNLTLVPAMATVNLAMTSVHAVAAAADSVTTTGRLASALHGALSFRFWKRNRWIAYDNHFRVSCDSSHTFPLSSGS